MNTAYKTVYGMAIKYDYLQRTIQTLKASLDMLHHKDSGSKQYDICRNAVLGSFELCLKSSDALLKKVLAISGGGIARFSWQEILQESVKQDLIPADEVERWRGYHEKCHRPAQEYDQSFAEDFLPVIEEFYEDACRLLARLVQLNTDEGL